MQIAQINKPTKYNDLKICEINQIQLVTDAEINTENFSPEVEKKLHSTMTYDASRYFYYRTSR